jgi:hypothetical protein
VRVTIAIEPKLSTVAEGIPAVASESSRESAAGVKPLRARRFTSPPRSALDCALIDSCTFAAKESIATSAATPSEIELM